MAARDLRRTPTGVVVAILEARHVRVAVGPLEPIDPSVPKVRYCVVVVAVGIAHYQCLWCDAQGAPLPPSQSMMRINPLDKRMPFIFVPRREVPDDVIANPHAHRTKMFAVRIVSWGAQGRFPMGAYVLVQLTVLLLPAASYA